MPPLLTHLSLLGLLFVSLSVNAVKVPPGLEPGLATNSSVLTPRGVKTGRCTELDPSIIEKFERQFTLDKQALASKLSSVIKHHRRLEGDDQFTPELNGDLSPRQSLQEPIDVYVHVISADSSAANGNAPVREQIDVLNGAFVTPAGRPYLSFNLAAVDRTVNADWFNNGGPGTPQQDAMKTALRRGGRADLNIYTVNFQGDWAGLLGYSTFPQSYNGAPFDDGVVVLFSTLPGGTTTGYNGGKTTVHETGHWVGLYHTFQGSCIGPGDYVEDTMPEGIPSQGCMQGRATCPLADAAQGETDPIHNYMDYSTDACMTEFTAGQMDRARQQLVHYRGIDFH
ncbi:zincin [Coprinellus micaceus]|uniref:Zincin n=1 Tax=Coprinellus micaceus TaxID=71717 RepID=A0A4Y7TJH8_COPMI|nr:zincin [Coprinellus micaceus]